MKKVWAVQLDLLERFQEVCHRHELKYFASGGTLLGAIRHKGYIPSDDDIDIMMLRDDYEKLLTIAAEEFPAPYFFQTAWNDKNYSRGHAQLRNSNTTAILKSEKGHFSFNQGIFIDIFPLDAVPDDVDAALAQRKKIKFYEKLLKVTVRYPANPRKNLVKNLVHAILSLIPYRWTYKQMEKACTAYNGQNTKRVGMISFLPDEERFVMSAAALQEVQTAPFENLTIDIPAGYDEVLTSMYNDYMTMRQENSCHGGVLFDTERSYLDYLR
jgi:lipopolysaccharide cholinephosphotransferase